ncbi:hypothetical protein V494_08065 [Pseudogymnoascus sp. VKM F-4513 (FW-928)]|nr:hypothetical protein V494_08065 [Pseudogymnoascus sp. VKM F-4513 (FW-928)]
MSNNAAGIGITNPNEFARRAAASEPDFSPYDALGIPARAYTTAEIGAAFRQAQRHLHRATAPPVFPSMAEVNTARDYLHDVAGRAIPRQTQAFARWARVPRTFFGELQVGDPGVFRPRPPPAPTPSPRAAPTPRGSGPSRPRPPRREPGDPFYTPPPRPERPQPRRRRRSHHPDDSPPMRPPPRRSNSPARSPPRTRSRAGDGATPNANPQGERTGDRSGDASGYTRRERTPPVGSAGRTWDSADRSGDFSGYTRRERTPPFGTTPENAHTIPSSDDDDDDAPPPTPTPSTRGAPPPRHRQQPPPPPHQSGGVFSGPPPPTPSFGAPPPTPSGSGPSPPLRENRSTGGSRARAAPVANPILGDEIIVGTWAHAPTGGAGANAVVGVFDRRGHLNFRIVSRTMAGAPTRAPTGTSVSLHNISLRPPYAGLDLAQLRTMIDQHIRLPRDQRP